MAVEIVWLDQAKDDLRSILEHISRENPRAATRYVEAIASNCERLADFPESGRRFDAVYRVLPVQKHLVFYRHDAGAGTVVIVIVIHGRRDVESLISNLPH